jgi:serine protease Do
MVNFPDGTKLPAEVIGTDPKTDIAVLKVKPESDLVAVKFGKSEKSRVGDWVVAIGNPFGLGGTVTAGIISAINRDINAGPYDDFIQTDASINRGNSGGPLFNMDGDVIGVNTAIISPSGGSIGIGFSVPAATAVPVIEQLQSFGETRRGWLGVKIQGVTDEIAEGLGMDEAMGALVAGVTEGGPAADAKLESGDVIVEFDGRDVPEMRDLPRMVAETEIGRDVVVVVVRDGERKKLSVTLGRLEEAEEKELADAKDSTDDKGAPITLGMSLSKIDDEARRRFSMDEDTKGVLVDAVDPASFAATQGLRAGDVIVEVAKEAVSTPAEVKKIVAEQKEKGRKSVLLLVSSTGDMRFVAVRIEEKK